MNWNLLGFAVLLLLSVGAAFLVYLLVRKSLRALLDEAVGLPACTAFYARLFSLGMLLIALAAALGTEFGFKRDAAFMEYVWKVADRLSTLFGNLCLFTGGFLVVVTVLVASLKRRHE
ncbi:MAG: hypothetical protein ACM3X6_07405 [Patescibacteria group bacterium]